MEIYFAEHPDINSGKTVISAYTQVGNREIRSQIYIDHRNYRQNYIDAAYQRLKDEVRQRALNEMRSQNHHEGTRTRTDEETAQFTRLSIPLVRRVYPQLIADNIVSVQPLSWPDMPLDWLVNYTFSENSGGKRKILREKVNWKKEGF